jgi:CubicO group peptidase (beta-lactamase class C family)
VRKFLFIVIGLGVAGALALLAYQRSGRPTTLEGLYDEYHARGVLMGIQSLFNGVVLVERDGEVILERAYGSTDPGRDESLTLDARFLIGAEAKPITATLVLQQVDAGVLALDGTVTDYLPEFPANPGQRITLHHLLSHTSGLPRDPVNLEDIVLGGVPGARYDFSNFGYGLLVTILEHATGRGYGDLVETGIVAPLGLTDTGYAEGDALAAEVASGMGFEETPFPVALVTTGVGSFNDRRLPGGASFFTSARDLHRIVNAMRDGELLSTEMTERLFAPNLAGYAYGWARNREWAITMNPEAPLYTHVGRLPGYNSLVGLYDDGTTVIVLANVDPLDVATILHDTWLVTHGLEEVESTLSHPTLGSSKRFFKDGGVEAFLAYYEELSEHAGYEIEPDGNSCYQVVLLMITSDRFDEAIDFMNTSVDNGWFGADPETLNGLGYSLLQRDRLEHAQRFFERNVELFPEVANGYDSLGECYERQGNVEAARESYTRALELARASNDSTAGFYERRLAGLDAP